MAEVTVREDAAGQRYVAHLPGHEDPVGFVAYRQQGDTVELIHTVVESGHEGQGIGSDLARGVLEDLRGRGVPTRVLCPFLGAYVRRHPELADGVEVVDPG